MLVKHASHGPTDAKAAKSSSIRVHTHAYCGAQLVSRASPTQDHDMLTVLI